MRATAAKWRRVTAPWITGSMSRWYESISDSYGILVEALHRDVGWIPGGREIAVDGLGETNGKSRESLWTSLRRYSRVQAGMDGSMVW